MLVLGPDFGAPPSFTRKKLLTVLGESRKGSSFIDNISIVKRYASDSSHAIPVCSDDEALSKAKKEVKLFPLSFFLHFFFCGVGGSEAGAASGIMSLVSSPVHILVQGVKRP